MTGVEGPAGPQMSDIVEKASMKESRLEQVEQEHLEADNLIERTLGTKIKKKVKKESKKLEERKHKKAEKAVAKGEGKEEEEAISKKDSDVRRNESIRRAKGEKHAVDSKDLEDLKKKIESEDTPEKVLEKIKSIGYHDPTLVDDILGHLEGENVAAAREQHNDKLGVAIRAGRSVDTKKFEHLGPPNELRDFYRDIIDTLRTASELSLKLLEEYSFEELMERCEFILHSVGNDLKPDKRGGPSIAKGKLSNIMTETRNVQAILGVYKFFNGRASLIKQEHQRDELEVPPDLNFKNMSKSFIGLISNRYPSSDKVIKAAKKLCSKVVGQTELNEARQLIIVISQFRDAIRQVSPRLYRSIEHRDDVFDAIIDALEELEDKVEELEEDE